MYEVIIKVVKINDIYLFIYWEEANKKIYTSHKNVYFYFKNSGKAANHHICEARTILIKQFSVC